METTITLAGITVHKGLLDFELPQGGQGDEPGDAVVFRPDDGQRLFGMSVGGSAALRLGSADGEHYALFRVVLDLPDLFRNGPAATPAG